MELWVWAYIPYFFHFSQINHILFLTTEFILPLPYPKSWVVT